MALSTHFKVIPALARAVIMCSLNAFAFEEIWGQGSVPDPQSSETPTAPASFLKGLSEALPPHPQPLSFFWLLSSWPLSSPPPLSDLC